MTDKDQRDLLELQMKQALELIDLISLAQPDDYGYQTHRADLKQVLHAIRKSSVEWKKRAY